MNRQFKQLGLSLCMLAGLVGISQDAQAFCGFYVNGAGDKLFNDATQVVMMRDGTKTVLSMRNNYQGPLKDFAMVVPVPVVLKKEQVKTLSDQIFQKVDMLAAPRLVQYWEQNPCPQPRRRYNYAPRAPMARGATTAKLEDSLMKDTKKPVVKIEAKFKRGEYDIVVLSATESNGLEKWLRANKYNIPKGASKALKPYVQQGMYFFVAKVDIKKVQKFNIAGAKRAMLSPLRFHYDTKNFSLPVRLGLLNARGKQDLIVHILAKRKRYEVANTKNVTIPTNLIVDGSVKSSFGEFYASLFDYTTKQNPGAVVTEYAWESTKCDPCPAGNFGGRNIGGPLRYNDLQVLGLDVLHKTKMRYNFSLSESTITQSGEEPTNIRKLRQHVMSKAYTCGIMQEHNAKNRNSSINGNVRLNIVLDEKDQQARVATINNYRNRQGQSFAQCMQESLSSIDQMTVKSFGVKGQSTVNMTVYFSDSQYMQNQWAQSQGWVLTRLHARYSSKDLKDDLVFKAAKPIIGGRGTPYGWPAKISEEGAKFSSFNNFQGRYMILNPWKGAMACKYPQRGRWGYPPRGNYRPPVGARDLAFVKRNKIKLSKAIKSKNQPGLPWYKKSK